jgi:heme/copper-type cytochrome/quinol oxidase subunit 4
MTNLVMQFWILAVVAVGVVVFIFLHIDDEGSGGW